MNSWIERFTKTLETRISRRSIVGRTGRAVIAAGAALAGATEMRPVSASALCSQGGGFGDCTGYVLNCGGCPAPYTTGWSWYCCNTYLHRRYFCQDCNYNGAYDHTCRIDVGYCGNPVQSS